MKKSTLFRGLTGTSAFLLSIVSGAAYLMFEYPGAVNEALSIDTSSNAASSDGKVHFKSKYTADGLPSDEGLKKLISAEMDFCRQEAEEGGVLLKNNGALPLAKSERSITLFGHNSTVPMYRTADGGPKTDPTREIDFKKAFVDGGFRINETIYSAYQSANVKRFVSNGSNFDIGECDASFYSASIKASYASDFKDAAIAVLTRECGEGGDLSLLDKDGVAALRLHQSEKDMLNAMKEGSFGKRIVLINSVNQMELGELANYNVDAILWIGGPGYYGLSGIVDLLKGSDKDGNAISPSGRLVDTFASDSLSSPAMMNYGDFKFSGDEKSTYIAELEGIYTGYKYYETRYEDVVLGQGNADGAAGCYQSSGSAWDYAAEMVYPFGYGLSYTTFSQSFVGSGYTYDPEGKTFTLKVNVKNTGTTSGKSVVSIYAQSPYTAYDKAHNVEKSAAIIAGYGKTANLAPGESEVVSVEVPLYYLASYDQDGAKGYIVEDGDYYFALADDVHDAVNNILAKKAEKGIAVNSAKMVDPEGNHVGGNAEKALIYARDSGKENGVDMDSFKTSPYTGKTITNKFDDIDVNAFYEGNDKQTYLSRSDWKKTYPKAAHLAINDKISQKMNDNSVATSSADGAIVTDKDQGIKFADMANVDMDSEEDQAKWKSFVEQISANDASKMLGDQFGTRALKSVGKPSAAHSEGISGLSAAYKYGGKGQATGYVSSPVLAATWNKEIMSKEGEFEAEDALYCNIAGFFGIGLDLHRTPYLGRFGSYWSEDGLYTAMSASNLVRSVSAGGVVSMLKHFCANDQETNRQGVCTFMREQAFREGDLRAFEIPVASGKSLGIMASYNRIGCTQTQCSEGLLTGMLVEEWGFKGTVITDAAPESTPENTIRSVMAGTTLFCESYRDKTLQNGMKSNGELAKKVQEACKRNLYAYAHSNLENGLSANTEVSDVVPWWQPAMISLVSVSGVVTFGLAVAYVLTTYVFGRKKKEENNEK